MGKVLGLFLSIFKIGAFTFGGGYAMIPLIEKEVVGNKGWITKEEFVDILKNNLSEFNNSDNKPTQSTAYYVVEINK